MKPTPPLWHAPPEAIGPGPHAPRPRPSRRDAGVWFVVAGLLVAFLGGGWVGSVWERRLTTSRARLATPPPATTPAPAPPSDDAQPTIDRLRRELDELAVRRAQLERSLADAKKRAEFERERAASFAARLDNAERDAASATPDDDRPAAPAADSEPGRALASAITAPRPAPPASPPPPVVESAASPAAPPPPIAVRATSLGSTAAARLPPDSSIIRGRVTFTGTPPQEIVIDMAGVPYCAEANPTPVTTTFLEQNPRGEIRYAAVYLSAGVPATSFPSQTPAARTIRYSRCLPHPAVVSMTAGDALNLANDDDTLHIPHALGELTRRDYFNLSMPSRGMVFYRSRDFTERDLVKIRCEVHPWEFAWVHVLPHPFHAVSDAAGEYEIVGVPPGSYEITVWQRKLGTMTVPITVPASSLVTVDFPYYKP